MKMLQFLLMTKSLWLDIRTSLAQKLWEKQPAYEFSSEYYIVYSCEYFTPLQFTARCHNYLLIRKAESIILHFRAAVDDPV